ncbi:E3 ubiquitin-protein ligase Kcmf1 isoform X2 [Episyrphus balteatus]|uniref:E3 ubiquitin-protein ligase Kcmf1 isoform X2 n=1 Tax=Episyrphus balteatus TaxID=286459 RepID=UPI0024851150|nr:E3 ubiquitin-protein ligase Kcmf1 isoform X2 [Episyrphus balteatus]
MSRHEGVSCDSCLKSNFNGRRYKCLICYDYDLCADCYEEGVTSTRHSVDHPMQCILTRSDIELFFGGEMLNSEQPQSFTCPYCKKMGFSDSTLLEHVSSEHTETSLEVVCPVCAGLPGGEPNLVTDDFAGHLTLEHRTGPRELLSFLDEPSAIRHGGGVRRIPGRTLGGPRSRRSNMLVNSSSGLSALSPSGRDSVDPIAELLSQLSGVRRGGGSGPQSSQLQQLQMQIQLERQQATRQQLERLPRRQAHPMVSSSSSNATMQEIGNGSSGTPSSSGGGTGTGGCRATEWTVNNTTTSSIQQSQSNVGGTSGSGSSTLNTREVPLNTSVLTVNDFGLSSCQFLQPAVGGSGAGNTGNTNSSDGGAQSSQFLLSKFMTPTLSEDELARLEKDRADRSLYVQAMLLSTLASFKHDSDWNSNSKHKNAKSQSETPNSSDSDGTTTVHSNAAIANNETTSDEQTVMNNNTMNRDQQQQTCPEDFVEEYSLQHQTSYNSNNAVSKKKPTSSGGKGGNQANATASAMALERRGRPPPPPVVVGGGAGGGTQPQQGPNQQKLTREMKTTSSSMSASNEIPDSR